jgi:predicted PurR-regulated permease PerM
VHNNIAAAIIVIVLFVFINEIGSKILYPRLVGQAIGLHEMLVLFAIFAGLELGGVIDSLLSDRAPAPGASAMDTMREGN